ncbi:MAG: ATP-binding protein [Gammaproteobacteria bacterium]|uniref:ATP-binding protein n=1 Tax=Rhodoferax sp. TaxID=50421 RepID=UPI00182CFA6B|nr:ATP-binding protein [Rhodoferax sp.]MBU3898138.1 ATP-binding protein [Gammaproteobacteria bacterium]MBA3058580.1 ATP-binding protein [Rhodoferax sp.]MBU3999105.1 ATP-binding protein [Gammaproteobacteria bacterium]MBU4081668.1 ATP-binding protein [Gammaproteobacteria bacterium]MBU4113848.1 ATP-binding protein [Gammaproteobacteria bacterium]
MAKPQLICLIGAECTGKSTLAQALADVFSGLWVPEHLRAFCALHGRTPLASEQALIMRAQFEQEERMAALAEQSSRLFVFCDSPALLTAIYSDYYFADRSLFEQAQVWHRRYALTLFLQPDLPWEPDGLLRDGASVRAAVHARVGSALEALRCPSIEVSGAGESRLQDAIFALRESLGAVPVLQHRPIPG